MHWNEGAWFSRAAARSIQSCRSSSCLDRFILTSLLPRLTRSSWAGRSDLSRCSWDWSRRRCGEAASPCREPLEMPGRRPLHPCRESRLHRSINPIHSFVHCRWLRASRSAVGSVGVLARGYREHRRTRNARHRRLFDLTEFSDGIGDPDHGDYLGFPRGIVQQPAGSGAVSRTIPAADVAPRGNRVYISPEF